MRPRGRTGLQTWLIGSFIAMGAVATVVAGWGVAQWPCLLPTSLKVEAAAAPDATLISVVVVFLLAGGIGAAAFQRGEAWVRGKILPPQGAAQRQPLLLGQRAHQDGATANGEAVRRRHIGGGTIAQPLRRLPGVRKHAHQRGH